MEKIDINALIERLRYFNSWRRGNEVLQPDPVQIGRDIDDVIAILEQHSGVRDYLSQALNEGDGVYIP